MTTLDQSIQENQYKTGKQKNSAVKRNTKITQLISYKVKCNNTLENYLIYGFFSVILMTKKD